MASVHRTEKYVAAFEKKINESKDISEFNKQAIMDYEDYLIGEGYSFDTINNKLNGINFIIKCIDKDFIEITERDVKRINKEIEMHKKSNGDPWAKSTKFFYKSRLKEFLKFLGNEGIASKELHKVVKPKLPQCTVQPQDVLTEEEVNKLINASINLRDKAMIALLYDIGVRVGELLTMQIKHYMPDDYGAAVTVTGKTGTRSVRLNFSVYYMRQWMNAHPDRENPEAWIWCPLRGKCDNRISYAAVKALLSRYSE